MSARQDDPRYVHENAAKVKVMRIALAMLAVYVEAGERGLTDNEATFYVGGVDGHETYRRRGSTLRDYGWIEWKLDADGKRIRRRTVSIGGTAGVCVVTERGRRAWAERA